jgi:L-histidine N-alpha-methyltransferase
VEGRATDNPRDAFLSDIREGLTATPRTISAKWLYDERGSRLFDEITRLPEYYPTEAERQILHAKAFRIAELTRTHTLVELGSGTSDKTRVLLEAFINEGSLRTFAPLDVSSAILHEAAETIRTEFPNLTVTSVVADFTALEVLPEGSPRTVAFLGGTIGNFDRSGRASLLQHVAAVMADGDYFLLGTDLVKDAGRLISAYNDSRGVTEKFIKNALRVINRDATADFDINSFTYVAFWDPAEERMDLRLRADRAMRVQIAACDLYLDVAANEEIRVEISCKFRLEGIAKELSEVGFTVVEHFVDDASDFALTLARFGQPEI